MERFIYSPAGWGTLIALRAISGGGAVSVLGRGVSVLLLALRASSKGPLRG